MGPEWADHTAAKFLHSWEGKRAAPSLVTLSLNKRSLERWLQQKWPWLQMETRFSLDFFSPYFLHEEVMLFLIWEK